MNKIIALLAFAFTLSGCTPHVVTTTSIYHGEHAYDRGTIYIEPEDQELEKSLAFKTLKNRIGKHLSLNGYQIVPEKEDASFIAVISYNSDGGKTTVSSKPIVGQTGGGTSYSYGTSVGLSGVKTYTGTQYTPPSYGVVGSKTVTETLYTIEAKFDIYRFNGKKVGSKVYEMQGTSTGSCGKINVVMPLIIDAMFKDFPGEDGKTTEVKTPRAGSC